MQSFLFYDLETTGLSPAYDQVLQFAAIRTDLSLTEISRHQFYVQLSPDRIPNVNAVTTHKITPDMVADGLSEYAAIKYIHALMNQPGTCSIGYNSLAFDDIFLRFSFHRNLLNPYTHQYANACSRADIMLMVLPFLNFAKSTLSWPEPLSLKLEQLVVAQGITMGAAHDAMNDVIATLELARLLSKATDKWQYVLKMFDKQHEAKLQAGEPAIFLTTALGYQANFMAPVIILSEHKIYKHKLLWRLDDPAWAQVQQDHDFSKLTLYKKKPGEQGFLWPAIDKFKQGLQLEQQALMQENLNWCLQNMAAIQSYVTPISQERYPNIEGLDVDAAIYQLGFKDRDLQQLCQLFTVSDWQEKVRLLHKFPEPYLSQARRIIWREAPELLPAADMEYINDYLASQQQPRLEHTGKSFLSRQELIQELSQSQDSIAEQWLRSL